MKRKLFKRKIKKYKIIFKFILRITYMSIKMMLTTRIWSV